jgi:hypothetical protein
LKAEGGVWRFSVVLGLLVAVVSFGGGLSVSAEEMEPATDLAEADERTRERSRFFEPDNISSKKNA